MRTIRTLVLLVFSTSALAQEAGQAVAQRAVAEPSLTGPFASLGQLTLRSTEDGTDVRAEIGLELPGTADSKADWLLSIGAAASIDKKDRVDLATESGLTSGTTADFRVTRIHYGRNYDPREILTTCRAYNDTLQRIAPIDIVGKACDDDTIRGRIQGLRDVIVREQVYAAYKDALQAAAIETCQAYNAAGAGHINDPVRDCIADLRDEEEEQKQLQAGTVPPLTFTNAHNQLANATSKPAEVEGCDDLQPAPCWQMVFNKSLVKARNGFCEHLNSNTTDLGLIDIRGGECNTDRLLELDEEYARRVREARGDSKLLPPTRKSNSLYSDALRAIKLAPSYFGLKASVDSQRFTWAEGSILDESEFSKETKQGLAISLAYGRLHVAHDAYFGLTGTVKRSYEGAKPVQICETPEGSNQATCRTVARSGPSHADEEVLTLEARKFVLENIAINPRANYGFHDEVFSLELLVYLFRSDAKGLNGGVHLTHRDDADGMTFAVFIGAPFRLFGS